MGRALVCSALCLLLAGCGRPEPPAPAVVGISGLAFAPPEITVRAGQAVVWRNGSDVEHDVASRGGEAFDSGAMAAGETFRRVFAKPGRYPYICSIHAGQGMAGVVVVTP